MSTPQEQLAPDLSSFALPPDSTAAPRPRVPRPRATPALPKPTLDPNLSAHVNDIIGSLKTQGYDVRLGETVRTPEQQAEKVAEGVSRTYNSKHLSGRPADLIVYRDGKPDWDTTNPAWQAIGTEAKQRGLRWGGDFKSLYDPGHVELSEETAPNLTQFALPHDAPDLSSFVLPDPDKQPLWQRAGLQPPGVAVIREGSNEPGAGEFWWVDDRGNKIRRVIAGDPLPDDQVDVEATLDRQTGQPLARTDPRRVVPVDQSTRTPLEFKQSDILANTGTGTTAAVDAALWSSKTPDLPAGFQTREDVTQR